MGLSVEEILHCRAMDILKNDFISKLNYSSLCTSIEFLKQCIMKHATDMLELVTDLSARMRTETTEWLRNTADMFLERNQIPPTTFCAAVVVILVMVTFIWCVSNGGRQLLVTDPESPRQTEVISIFEMAKTACLPGHADQVMELVSKLHFDVNFPIPTNGMTLFLCACISGHKELVSFLLDKGADVSVTNSDGDTCLYLATFACAGSPSKDFSTLELLLSAGCEVNAQNHKGYTPLHWAASKGDSELIRFLLKHGADPFIRNGIGMYPVGMATSAGHLGAGKLLKISLPDSGDPSDMFEPHTPIQVRLGLMSPRKDHLALSPRPRKRLDLSI